MAVFICVVLCLVLSGAIEVRTEWVHSPDARHLIKRQAQSFDQGTASNSQRHFVSPDGDPYYEYQPPVSSGRGVSHGRVASSQVSIGGGPSGRKATSQVTISGGPLVRQVKPAVDPRYSAANPAVDAAGPRYSAANPAVSTGLRGRTYAYPFGRERVQYTGAQPQGQDQQAARAADSRSGTDGSDWQKEAALPQQHPALSSSSQRSISRGVQNESSQVQANQQPDYDAALVQAEELRRKQEDLRRKHEDERRRKAEIRRRLLDERKRQGEERRRQYYEQQQRANQQQPQGEDTQPSATRQEQTGLTHNRRQQPNTQMDTDRRVPPVVNASSQYYPQRPEPTNQREHQVPIISPPQAASSAPTPDGSQPRRQLPAYNSPQGTFPYQQPGYRTNTSHYPVPHSTPQQQPVFLQGYNRQTGQVDPRHQGSQASFPSSSSNSEQVGQGQVQGYPNLERRSNYGSSSSSSPSSERIGLGQVQGYPNLERRSNSGSSTSSRTSGEQIGQGQVQGYPNLERRSNSGSSSFYRPTGEQIGQGQIQNPNLERRSHLDSSSSSSSSSEQVGQGQVQSFPNQEKRSNSGSSFSFEQQDNDSDCPDTGIDLRINGLDCQQAVQQYGGYLCYTHEYTSKDCCHVCKPRKQPLRTGCEYGDHAELCSSIAAADCYDLRNRYSCCQTCDRLRRSNLPEGCEYGDMTVRCENVRQNPGLCYIPDNQRLCCETCSQIRNVTNQGCPWGDYNPNLCQLFEENTANVRINCYSQQRRKLCCQSCDRLREWASVGLPADCQYGDRPVIFTTSQHGRLTCANLFNHFGVDECRTNEAVAVNCCHTCHRLLNTRG